MLRLRGNGVSLAVPGKTSLKHNPYRPPIPRKPYTYSRLINGSQFLPRIDLPSAVFQVTKNWRQSQREELGGTNEEAGIASPPNHAAK